jgi:hypothetical protein
MSLIGEQMRERQRRLRSALEQRFDGRDAAFWRTRFATAQRDGPPLRVVGFTNRYSTVIQHAMRDLASAFARKGHEFEIIAQPDDCSAAIDVAGALAVNADRGRACDMIVAINHLRFEYPDSMPRNVPLVGWIQDHMDHLWKREAGDSIGELDLVVAHAPHVLASLYGYPAERVLASSNLTDPHVYSDQSLPENELAPNRCDLSFVSHGAATPEMLVNELGAATTPAFHRLLERFLQIAREQLQESECVNAAGLVELMLRAERQAGGPPLPSHVRRAHVYPQIAKIHDRLFRHQTLQWAANWARSRKRTMRIYGRGWDKHPTLAEFACGEVASGRPLRAVYQASKVNLQANAYASLHQRLLDGLACGACMLARYNPADFVRRPFVRIAETIASRSLRTLDELVALRRRDADFGVACDEAERLSNAVIALSSDPRRNEHMRIQREGNDIAELQSDEGLFAALRDMRFMPARVAADLPGFEQIVFRDEAQMHALLDRLADDDALRQTIARPMREAVLAHDTYDALVDRIISAFARGSAA